MLPLDNHRCNLHYNHHPSRPKNLLNPLINLSVSQHFNPLGSHFAGHHLSQLSVLLLPPMCRRDNLHLGQRGNLHIDHHNSQVCIHPSQHPNQLADPQANQRHVPQVSLPGNLHHILLVNRPHSRLDNPLPNPLQSLRVSRAHNRVLLQAVDRRLSHLVDRHFSRQCALRRNLLLSHLGNLRFSLP